MNRIVIRRWAIATTAVSLTVLLAGCGSRVPHEAIVNAARGLVSSSSQAGGTSSGAPTSGAQGTLGTSVTSTTTGSSPTGGGAHATASGSTGGAAPGAPTSGGGTANAASGSAINIGNVGTYSGLIGAIFSGGQQTMQVWEAYTNAHGGLNGHPVHLYLEDDGGDPSTSESEVEQEVTQDHVIAFVGNLVPLTVSASVAYLQQQDIPVIGGDSASVEWWQSPVLFPQASYLGGEADQTIRLAVAKGDTKLGYLYCIEDPTCTEGYQTTIVSGNAKADGADSVYSSSYSLTQPDFTAQCLAAQQAGVQVMFMSGDGDSLVRLARDCAAQNFKPLYIADSLGVTASVQADPLLNGLLSNQSTFPWVDSYTSAQATYQAAMKQYAPSVAGSATTSAEWTAGMLAVAADKDLGATPTSAQFFQGLWSIKNNNLGGLAPPLTFPAHAPATPSECFFEMILTNGQFVDPDHGNSACISGTQSF